MYNELITIGNFTIHSYGLLITIGFISAMIISSYMSKKYNLNKEEITNLALIIIVSGIIGAKVLYCLVNIKDIIKNPNFLLSGDGFVVYGGIISALVISFLYCKKRKLDFLSYTDLILPSVFIAQGFGRLGCFFAGCCYGKEYNGFGSIIFRNSTYAPNNIGLFPTQLISSGYNFLIGAILLYFYYKKKLNIGIITALYLLLYGTGRFFIEFLRGDIERGNIGILSTSQFISIFIIILGIFLLRKKGEKK